MTYGPGGSGASSTTIWALAAGAGIKSASDTRIRIDMSHPLFRAILLVIASYRFAGPLATALGGFVGLTSTAVAVTLKRAVH